MASSMLILSGGETLLEKQDYYVYFLRLTSSVWCLTACSAPFIARAACKTPPTCLWTVLTQHLSCVWIHQTAYKTFTHTPSHCMAVELRFTVSLKVALARPTIRGRPARAGCKCSIFSFIYIFISSLIRPELGLPAQLQAVKQQRDKSCVLFHIYGPQTYPGINHLNPIFLLQQFLFVMAVKQPIEQHAECGSLLSVSRNEKRSPSPSEHIVSVCSPERLFHCWRPASLQHFYQSFALRFGGCVYNSHWRWEKSCSLLEGSLPSSLQPAIRALKRFINPAMCVSLLCSRACVD